MKKHLPLIIGFAIPVLLVIAVIFSIYIPRWFVSAPQTNFLFLSNSSGYSKYPAPRVAESQAFPGTTTEDLYNYQLQGDKLVVTKVTTDSPGYEMNRLPTVYFYDVKSNSYRVVKQEELGNYTLLAAPVSPDGFEISSGNRGSGIFEIFAGSYDYYSRYLTKDSYSQKLNLPLNVNLTTQYCYNLSDCGFAGWVTQETK